MIKEWIIDSILKNNDLSKEDKVILRYGLLKIFLLFEDAVITLFFGYLLNIVIESIIFQVLFILLRMYAGGCHSKTEWQCKVHSILVTIIALLCIKLMSDDRNLAVTVTLVCSIKYED